MEKSKMQVLVVDDNTNMRRTIRHMLGDQGFTLISEAPDGDQALIKLTMRDFDLVICDWNMPNVKGIEVLQEMRKNENLKDIPFVMVTAEIDEDIVAQAAEGDVGAYVIKPFTAEILRDKIDTMLRRKSAPNELETLAQLAEVYRKGNMREQAIEAYEKILAKQPAYGPAMLGMAEIAMDDGNAEEAEGWLNTCIETQPRFAKAYDARARFYEKNGDDEARLEALHAAAKLSPLDSSRQVHLAEAKLKCGDPKGARECFQKAVQINPAVSEESERIAEAFLSSGHYDEAVELFEIALERDPTTLHTYNRMGIAYRRQKRYDEAIKLYDRALKAAPQNTMVMYNKGCAYLEWSKMIEAGKSFEIALEWDPNFSEAREALKMIQSTKSGQPAAAQ